MTEQRYRVIERLAAGGMAEVFVGEQQSHQGFKKKVAIKRVLPHLAQNKNFIGMFLDEARLGAQLTHANIVSVFDIGAADNTYFIVMEFVDGANLKKVMDALKQMGRSVPIKAVIYISMEACRGLSFAHDLMDEEGHSMHLVHRDVSPPNIMISKRGEVKVTDFGLAKATTQLEKTDPGVVKGKFSYLAPEAARGEDVDARADVFAMGVVLWEMLAGRRLFLGETDYQTVKLVQQTNVPSLSRLNPEVDAEFEGILGKSLTSNPDERYQSARDFGDALAGYLFGHKLKVTSYDIAALVKQCLATEVKPARQEQQQSIIDKLIQEELLRFTSLEDMSNPLDLGSDPLVDGATPLSPDDVLGAAPLDAGAFENPAEWFTDDADVAAAIDGSPGNDPTDSEPGWRESGIEDELGGMARSLEHLVEPTMEPLPIPEEVSAEVALDAAPVATPTPARGGSTGKIVAVLLVLLVGAAAAAYFGGLLG